MRYFFRRCVPSFDRVLLVESGSRRIFDEFLPGLPALFGEPAAMDLVTCYPGEPAGYRREAGRVYRVTDYSGRAGRRRLYRELAARGYRVAVIICSGEPIMMKWKWALAVRLPVKVLVVNENSDCFWLDWGNWRTISRFVAFRSGFSGAGAVRMLARVAVFPFTLAYLLLYTAMVHIRRHIRRKVHA